MIKRYCDRCEQTLSDIFRNEVKVTSRDAENGGEHCTRRRWDLCYQCYEHFYSHVDKLVKTDD